jgi:Major tropism determinant N-terminal domain
MASKIQLRRDLAASWANINPILAQGEPGAELDTGKMKLGDGVTAWNQLPYTSSNDYEDKFVFLLSNSNRYAAGVSTSRDGLHWTGGDITSEYWDGNYNSTYAYALAVGNGRVAYLAYNYIVDRDVVLFSETPGSAIVDPNYTRFLEEQGANAQRSWVSSQDFYEYFGNDYQNQNWVTMYATNGESISWHNIKFQGGYFIAIGSYNDNIINDGRNRPYFAYSQDAVHWTRGYVDLGFVTSKMNAFADAYDNQSYAIKDVNYNGHGWLFSMHYEWDTINNNDMTGAFYMTDLSSGFTSETYFGMNGAYSMSFDGQGWGGYMGNSRMIFSSNTDPRLGGWREIAVSDAQQQVWGDEAGTNWNNSRSFVGGPLADGTPMFMVALSNGRILATTNQGQSFGGSTPAARVDSIYDWDTTNPAVIFVNNEDSNGNTNSVQQVVITGSKYGRADGTFYAQHTDTRVYTLYHDFNLNYPVNGTSWNIGGLFNDAYITFTQQGIGFEYISYGGSKFVGFSGDSANNYMTQDGLNWKYGLAWNAIYGSNDNSFDTEAIAYGRVSTDGQIVINDDTYPGGANSLTLGNNFDVQVNSGEPLSAYTSEGGGEYSDGTGYLTLRPYNAQWRIGTYGRTQNSGPEPYSFIGADDYFDYFDGPDYSGAPDEFPGGGDIRLTTWNGDWYLTANPYLNTGTTVNNQLIMPSDADIVNNSGESFLKDIPQNNLGNATSYTLQWTDRGRFLWMDGTSQTTNPGDTNPIITIPLNADVNFPIGTRIQMIISGATNSNIYINVHPASGVTLVAREGNNSRVTGTFLVPSDTIVTLIQVNTDYWILSGAYITD